MGVADRQRTAIDRRCLPGRLGAGRCRPCVPVAATAAWRNIGAPQPLRDRSSARRRSGKASCRIAALPRRCGEQHRHPACPRKSRERQPAPRIQCTASHPDRDVANACPIVLRCLPRCRAASWVRSPGSRVITAPMPARASLAPFPAGASSAAGAMLPSSMGTPHCNPVPLFPWMVYTESHASPICTSSLPAVLPAVSSEEKRDSVTPIEKDRRLPVHPEAQGAHHPKLEHRSQRRPDAPAESEPHPTGPWHPYTPG